MPVMPKTTAVIQMPSECHKAIPTVTNMVTFTAYCLRLHREVADLPRCCRQTARQEPVPALWSCFVRCLSWWLCVFIYFYLYIFFLTFLVFVSFLHCLHFSCSLFCNPLHQELHLTVTECDKTAQRTYRAATKRLYSTVQYPPAASHKICAKV